MRGKADSFSFASVLAFKPMEIAGLLAISIGIVLLQNVARKEEREMQTHETWDKAIEDLTSPAEK